MKKILLVLIPVIILVIGGFIFIKSRSGKTEEAVQTPVPTSSSIALPENQEKDAQVSLTVRVDKKAVILKITKIPSDVVKIEHELTYVNSKGQLQGPIGKIDVNSQEAVIKEILLGTCSKNVCVYDEGVKKVSLVLKFTKSSGESTGFSQEYEL